MISAINPPPISMFLWYKTLCYVSLFLVDSLYMVSCFVSSDFVYERNQYNVIEVNETNYISCNPNNPIANWSRGSGRDLVHLNVTRHYYLISGNGGGCYGGMKLAVLVEKSPPPPAAAPNKSSARSSLMVSGFSHQFVIPVAVFAVIGTMWDKVLRLW